MKPLSINLKSMKKIGGDKHSSTFLHDDGHKMVIAHAPLPTLQRKQLERLPVHQMAEGGQAAPEYQAAGQNIAQNVGNTQGAKDIAKAFGAAKAVGGYIGVHGYAEGTPDAPVSGGDEGRKNISSSFGGPGPLNDYANKKVQQSYPQKMAEGTPDAPVSDEVPAAPILGSANDINHEPDAPIESTQKNSAPVTPVESDTTKQVADLAPNAVVSATAPPAVPSATQPILPENIQAAVEKEAGSIKGQQSIAGRLAAQEAGIEKTDLEAKQDLDKQMTASRTDFENHRTELMKLYNSQDIKPNHYLENMSVPGKVATAIGLMLGGIGSAYTHQGNPAAQFLNDQINRDLEGQKARQDQTKTLLGENEKFFQDKQLGYNAARVAQNDIYSHQIAQARDRLGTPLAKLIGDQKISELATNSNNLLYQSSLRQTLQKNLASGSGGQGTTANMFADAGLLPHEQAMKEDGSIQAAKNAVEQTNHLYEQLGGLQTLKERALHPIESREQINSLNAQLNNIVQSADVNKRMNPETVELQLRPFHIGVVDTPETIASKQQGVLNLIKQVHAGTTPFMSEHAPKALPNFNVQKADPLEGQTASGPNGAKLIRRGGQWAVMAQPTQAVVSNGQ